MDRSACCPRPPTAAPAPSAPRSWASAPPPTDPPRARRCGCSHERRAGARKQAPWSEVQPSDLAPRAQASRGATMSAELRRLHAVVSGRVQGVGYRATAQDEARALGLGGWVRNRADGTVEVDAEGEDA